jgi:hypothetical protein
VATQFKIVTGLPDEVETTLNKWAEEQPDGYIEGMEVCPSSASGAPGQITVIIAYETGKKD